MHRLDRSLIAGLPAFQGLDDSSLDAILQSASSLRVTKDQAIFDQDSDAHSFFVLLDGRVEAEGTSSLDRGPETVDLPIGGVQRLRLEATDTTCNGEYYTHRTYVAWGSPIVSG